MNRLFPVLCLGVVLGACKSDTGLNGEQPPVWVINPPPLEDVVKTDAIVQVTTPMVDVLWVMDNSGSMSCVTGCHGSLTDNVVESFPRFMDYFIGSGLDYHVGVITTDLDDPNESGRLEYGLGLKYIEVTTSDPIAVFFEMATVGTEGSGQERGLGTTFNAIDLYGDTYNAGFYREEATLHTTVLSNEDDFTPPNLISQPEFVDWYGDLKEESDERTFNSLVCVNNSEECPDIGTQYIRTSQEVGGVVWDVAGDNWDDLLDQLGAQAAGLKREYFLSQLPVPDSIVVQVEEVNGAVRDFEEAVGDPPVGDWTYDANRNSITFLEYIPTSLSTVLITYKVASSVVENAGEEVVETAGQ